ncbi:MAG: PatB family C-S lyase [Bacteroidales bacterium]|nr:PatB family C-S lyase [Bacteroidales bacterium]
MHYDFDKISEREGTACVKYDLREMYFKRADVLPMWVADMDFETPDFIREAIIERASNPLYGYTFRDENYYSSIINWLERRHQWHVEKDWILFTPGVVPALNLAVLSYTNPGDKIIVQPPVYFPFFTAVKDHNRTLVYNQLIKGEKNYSINFEQLEELATDAKMLILCNPHNPVGRAWTKDELERIAEICLKNNVLVLSDEIHNDLILKGHRHQVFADISPEVANITITAHAPSKTFNIAGMATSSVIISNKELRLKFEKTLKALHVDMGNLFGFVASTAAFSKGDEWLRQLLEYVQKNVDFTESYLLKHLPKIKMFRPEATYMIWLDFGAYGLSDNELNHRMIMEAELGLSQGITFGPGGESCMRLNVACSKEILIEALEKLRKVF